VSLAPQAMRGVPLEQPVERERGSAAKRRPGMRAEPAANGRMVVSVAPGESPREPGTRSTNKESSGGSLVVRQARGQWK